MTAQEVRNNANQVSVAKLNEILGLYHLTCFERKLWTFCSNTIDARWVNARKFIDRNIVIKCMFIVRGFKDIPTVRAMCRYH